ncbi:MAG: magnesium transporter [Thermoguttaceae bacterium]|nr:magnesium transporter [Thermoguttaceae bacterium]
MSSNNATSDFREPLATSSLLLPELREMIATNDVDEMRVFCSALHPASTAEFLQDLEPDEIWKIFKAISPTLRAEIFSYFERDRQVLIVETCPRAEVAKLLEETPSDDRVDLLADVDPEISEEVTKLLSKEDQRDVALLGQYDDDECGAEMSSDFFRLRADMTVGEAIAEISAQTNAHLMETVYYLYVLDADGKLAGVVSAKDLLRRINQQDTPISSFMRSAGTLVTVNAREKREEAIEVVKKYDFIALPVVDSDGKMLGVITHDDVLDAAVEELVENAHMSAAVAPLDDETYLGANLFLLARKRFTWLAILLFGAITTALILKLFNDVSDRITWLVAFLPMIVSTGGNSGGQSATLVITALATGEIDLIDWKRILRREFAMGAILGLAMGVCGLINALIIHGTDVSLIQLMIVPLAVFFVVFSANLTGAMLPLLFQKLKLDPALMSNPFVAGISDTLGTFIYMALAAILIAPFYRDQPVSATPPVAQTILVEDAENLEPIPELPTAPNSEL